MTGKPCSPLPITHRANINVTAGWVASKPPTGMVELSCGRKYADGPYYHATLAGGSMPMAWGVTPKGATADLRFVADILEGVVELCGQYQTAFGTGSLACKPERVSATRDKPVRIVVAVQELGQRQPGKPVSLVINAVSDGVVIGQISTAEATD